MYALYYQGFGYVSILYSNITMRRISAYSDDDNDIILSNFTVWIYQYNSTIAQDVVGMWHYI